MAKRFQVAFSVFGTLAALCDGLYAADAPVGMMSHSYSVIAKAKSTPVPWLDGIMEHVKLTIGSCLTEKIKGEWLFVIGVINPQESKFDCAEIREKDRAEGWGDLKRQFKTVFLNKLRCATVRIDVPVAIKTQTEKVIVRVWEPQKGGGIPVIAISNGCVMMQEIYRGIREYALSSLSCPDSAPNYEILSCVQKNVLNAVKAYIAEKTKEQEQGQWCWLTGIVCSGSDRVDSAMFVTTDRWERCGDYQESGKVADQVRSGNIKGVANVPLDGGETITIACCNKLDNDAIPVLATTDQVSMELLLRVLSKETPNVDHEHDLQTNH